MDNFRKHAPQGLSVIQVNLEESMTEKDALNAARKFPVLHSTERGAERVISQVYPYAAIGYKGQQIVIDLPHRRRFLMMKMWRSHLRTWSIVFTRA